MKYTTFFSLLLVSSFVSIAQNVRVKASFYNSITKEKIPYVTIKLFQKTAYTDADENGQFEMQTDENDTLTISCIGYRRATYLAKSIVGKDSVFLLPDVKEMATVTVGKFKPLRFGTIDKRQTRSHIGSSQYRYESATLIEVPVSIKQFRIKRVRIVENRFDESAPFRLHLYQIDKDGLPGEEMLLSEVVATSKNFENGKMEFDISDQSIVCSASFFVGIEWMSFSKSSGKKKNEHGIGETDKINRILTYRRGKPKTNNRWYIEYENGYVFPKMGNAESAGVRPSGKNPINILLEVEVDVF